ncbi:Glycosyl transferase family 2 [Devosia crocina]|uniref:Glycosyl transferase family 2 n=1 Tax=Devosia crocina TaxID=429728 RepID=A0A1I7MZ01_9HYPH|nr:Glycosyl transferase family 2 [Devosia crocina]
MLSPHSIRKQTLWRHPPLHRNGAAEARVTVVIPCYNYGRYLSACVRSALDQEGVRVDLVIVDDASTDDSAEVAARLAASNDRVKLIRNDKNSGPVSTFNRGLEHARGEFLVRLDADDLLTPGSLARAVTVARQLPSVGLIYGHPLHFTADRLPCARSKVTAWTVWPGLEWLGDRCRSGYNVITSPEAVMRMSVVERVGGQQPLAHTHDMEMWLRIAAFSDVAYIHGVDQAWHREHSASLSARKVDGYRDLVERHLAFETLFRGVAGGNPRVAKLRAVAMTAIARSALQSAIHCLDHGQANSPQMQRFLEVANQTGSDLTELPEWRALMRRFSRDPQSLARDPAILLERIMRRLSDTLKWRRWHRSGVF